MQMVAAFVFSAFLALSAGFSQAADKSLVEIVTKTGVRAFSVEMAVTPDQLSRGLMFRTELPPTAGMLFVFMDEAERSFWMYRTKIPLDILWLNANHQIVEISADTPPCPGESRDDCPSFGGNVPSQFVLEIGAGQAAAHGLKVGDRLNF